MPTKENLKKEKPMMITFGSGLKLLNERFYVEALDGLLTLRGFRLLCRRLHVPMIEFTDTRYVDMLRFEIALSAVLRIGEPDFYAPGSMTAYRSAVKKQGGVDPKQTNKNYRVIAAELLLAKRINGVKLSRAQREDLRETAKMMTDHVQRITQDVKLAQQQASRQAYRHASHASPA